MATPSKNDRGKKTPGVLGVSNKLIWCSAGFVPFGASQKKIGARLGLCDRSIRGHLATLKIEKRQIVQASKDNVGLEQEARILGNARLTEPSGFSQEVERGRFFECRGKTWLRRCNLYDLDFSRYTLSAKRTEHYKRYGIDLSPQSEKFQALAAVYLKPGQERASKAVVFKIFKDNQIQAAVDKYGLSISSKPSNISRAYTLTFGRGLGLSFSQPELNSLESSQTLLEFSEAENRGGSTRKKNGK